MYLFNFNTCEFDVCTALNLPYITQYNTNMKALFYFSCINMFRRPETKSFFTKSSMLTIPLSESTMLN